MTSQLSKAESDLVVLRYVECSIIQCVGSSSAERSEPFRGRVQLDYGEAYGPVGAVLRNYKRQWGPIGCTQRSFTLQMLHNENKKDEHIKAADKNTHIRD